MTEFKIICQNCVLPHGFLGININSNGLCNYCQDSNYKTVNWSKIKIDAELKKKLFQEWNRIVSDMQKMHGKQEYDCVLGYSGGKDSTALLDTIKNEYQLNPFIVIIDTGFMTDIAKENVKKTLTKMEISKNSIIIKDAISTFTKIYKHFFLNHNSNEKTLIVKICEICTNLIHTIIVKQAIKKRIQTVIIGFSPDQIKRYFFETPKNDIINDGIPHAKLKNIFDTNDLNWYLTEDEIASNYFPRILYPYHVIKYDEKEIIHRIENKGLIEMGKGDPIKTNCHVVKAALMYDLYRYGGLTYILQYAELVRQQKDEVERIRSRKNWLRIYNQVSRAILNGNFNEDGIKMFFDNIDVSKKELLQKIMAQRDKDPNKKQILKNLEMIKQRKLK